MKKAGKKAGKEEEEPEEEIPEGLWLPHHLGKSLGMDPSVVTNFVQSNPHDTLLTTLFLPSPRPAALAEDSGLEPTESEASNTPRGPSGRSPKREVVAPGLQSGGAFLTSLDTVEDSFPEDSSDDESKERGDDIDSLHEDWGESKSGGLRPSTAGNVRPVSSVLDGLDREHLALGHRGLGLRGACAVCESIRTNAAVRSLDLTANRIGSSGGRFIADMLVANTTLTFLSLACNALGNRAGRIVSESLRHNQTLTSLSLADNSLGSEAAIALSSAMLEPNRALTELDLSNNRIGEKGGAALAELLEANENLVSCSLDWNDMRGAGGGAILDAVATQHGLDGDHGALSTLTLSWNGLDDVAAPAIGRLISATHVLAHLDLSHNRLATETATEVAAALPHCTGLRTLMLGFNPLGLSGTLAVISSLEENRTLRHLGVENTTHESASGDDQVQRVFERAVAVSKTRSPRRPLEILVEYPARNRVAAPIDVEVGVEDDGGDEVVESRAENSVFQYRPDECDSHDFYDTADTMDASLEIDWKLLEGKLRRFIKSDGVISRVRNVIATHYVSLCNVFRHYSTRCSEPSLSTLSRADFTEMVAVDADVLDSKEGGCCSSNTVDIAFVAADVKLIPDGEIKELIREANSNNFDKALHRHEVLEALTRIAKEKYCQNTSLSPGASDEAEALERILREHVLPKCDRFDSNAFRWARLYMLDVHKVVLEHETLLRHIFEEYASKVRVGGKVSNAMLSLSDFLRLMHDAKLITAHFPEFEANLAFVFSQMKTKHELVRKAMLSRKDVHDALTWTEFLESLAHVASFYHAAEVPGGSLPDDAYVSQKLGRILQAVIGVKRASKEKEFRAYFDGSACDVTDDFWRLREHHRHLVCPGVVLTASNYAFETSKASGAIEGDSKDGKWVPPFAMSQDTKGINRKEVMRRVAVKTQILAAFGDLTKYPSELRKEVEALESRAGNEDVHEGKEAGGERESKHTTE